MDYRFGLLKHIRKNIQNTFEIYKYPSVIEKSLTMCSKFSSLGYIYASAPSEGVFSIRQIAGKLLLLVNNSRLQVLESRNNKLFQTTEFLVSNSDNFLKQKEQQYIQV